MCKIFVFTNMSKIKNVNKTINVIAKHITKRERDGFGYAIQGENGLFGERTNQTENFQTSDQQVLKFNFLEANYNRIGEKSKIVGAGIFHGRTSTNHKTLINTHPIQKHDWTLIHNGVVNNHGPDYSMITSNDTEHLIHYLANHGIGGIEKNLTGYYAVAAFSPDKKLHVFRDDTAKLFFAYIKSIDSYVIGTTEDLINDILIDLKLESSKIFPVKDNQYLIFNKNQIESVQSIKPRGYSYNESKYADLSLGKKLTNKVLKIKKQNDSPMYSDDEILFLEEVNTYADSSYTFLDYYKKPLDWSEFKSLSNDEKLFCTVIRSDGTIVSSSDYQSERLYMG